jgi:hypothetical protein
MTDYNEDIDAFAVRCRENEQLYWVPGDEAGSKSTCLRLTDPAIDRPRVKPATEYRFDVQLP